MRLHAETAGSGPTLVLLHGFTGSTASWDLHRDALAARFHVVAIDLPGHGRSPLPTGDLRAVAASLVAVLDRLAVPRAHWLGYSLGGRAALHVALATPERVERLVLESASPGIADSETRLARARADAALADAIVRDGLEAFVEVWVRQPFFATQARVPAALRARERAVRLAGSASGLAAALRALGVGTQAPLWEHLGAIPAPTLLIVGAEDPPYRRHAAAMAARMPNARVAVIPDAGHTVHLEQPAAFRAAVADFLGAAPLAA